MLAARYRRPVPVILGILVATLANHALAAWLGAEVAVVLGRDALRWILGFSFLAMAAWTLIPDKLEKERPQSARLGAFAATLVAFFLVEMGDKTQIATAALAARYASIAAVVAQSYPGDIECIVVHDQEPPDESLRLLGTAQHSIRVAANRCTPGESETVTLRVVCSTFNQLEVDVALPTAPPVTL